MLGEAGRGPGRKRRDLFSSERLLRECRSFVRQASGRAEAQAGEHDDCVMAMALALAVREGTARCETRAVA